MFVSGDAGRGGQQRRFRAPVHPRTSEKSHKKLDVYRCAVDFVAVALRVEVPRGFASLGAAMECSAILDCCKLIGAIGEHDAAHADGLLERLVSMLTRVCG